MVWCPKYRRKILTNGVDARGKELLLEYATNSSVDIMEREIMPDHAHILMEVDPQFGVYKAVKSFKGYTSKVLRSEFPFLKTKMPSRWTNNYYKATWYGNEIIKVPARYPSSQTCSTCGYKNALVKNLTVRKWECPACHTKHDRDANASINILNKGLQMLSA